VLVQLEHLMAYRDVRRAVENGRSFAVIDRSMAERLTGGE